MEMIDHPSFIAERSAIRSCIMGGLCAAQQGDLRAHMACTVSAHPPAFLSRGLEPLIRECADQYQLHGKQHAACVELGRARVPLSELRR